jgi:hypothetical protein
MEDTRGGMVMKLNKKMIRKMILEEIKILAEQEKAPNKPYKDGAYFDQTITDASIFEDPEAILENITTIKSAITGFWDNDQILWSHIQDLNERIEQLESSLSE